MEQKAGTAAATGARRATSIGEADGGTTICADDIASQCAAQVVLSGAPQPQSGIGMLPMSPIAVSQGVPDVEPNESGVPTERAAHKTTSNRRRVNDIGRR